MAGDMNIELLLTANSKQSEAGIEAVAAALGALEVKGTQAEQSMLEATVATARARKAAADETLRSDEAMLSMAKEFMAVGEHRAAIERGVSVSRANAAAATRLAAAAEDALARSQTATATAAATADAAHRKALSTLQDEIRARREAAQAERLAAEAAAAAAAAELQAANRRRGINAVHLQQSNAILKAWEDSARAAQSSGEEQYRAGKKAAAGIDSISTQLSRAQSALMLFFEVKQVADFVIGIAKVADEWNNVHARLRLAVQSQREYATAETQLFQIAQRTSSAMAETTTLYARLAEAGHSFNLSQGRILALTQTINQATQLSGAAAESSKAALIQLGQALSSGVLRGDEFNSVMEQAPAWPRPWPKGWVLPRANCAPWRKKASSPRRR